MHFGRSLCEYLVLYSQQTTTSQRDKFMSRLTPITQREQVSGDALIAFDAIIESRGRINGPQSMHMYAPEVARWSTALSDSLRFNSDLSEHDTELAIITAAREMDCEFVWAAHAAAASKVGVRPEAIETVGNKAGLEGLTSEEAVIVRYGRETLGDHNLSQEAFDAALGRFGERGTIVLGALMGYYSMIACTLIATDVRPAEGTPVLPKLS
jgi:4-carboxymuconolactone decarboxylase